MEVRVNHNIDLSIAKQLIEVAVKAKVELTDWVQKNNKLFEE